MFANTQMMGTELGFPDAALAPSPKPAQSTSWLDAVLSPSPSPAQAPAPIPSIGPGGFLSQLTSFLPQVHPSVAGGGMMPSPLQSLNAMLPPAR